MRAYGRLCGDDVVIATYLGSARTFDIALGTFAVTFADQNECDYAELREASNVGRVAATVVR